MLVVSALAIVPTWVIFRNSPRNTHHSLPEGFFIQVFFQTLTLVLSLLAIPLEFIHSQFGTIVYDVLIMCYYFVGYKQLFGYGYWGTLWRQVLVFICVIFFFLLLIRITYPEMMDTVVEAFGTIGYFFEYIL